MPVIIHKTAFSNSKSLSAGNTPALVPLSLSLSPLGHLFLYVDLDTPETLPKTIAKKIGSFFSISESVGLLRLGLSHFSELPPSFSFWQQFAQLFVTEIFKHVDPNEKSPHISIAFPVDKINRLIEKAPFIRGIDYLNQETARLLWTGLVAALSSELTSFNGIVSDYLTSFHVAWNTIGRVCFHLAENKTNANYPFAFLATYTVGLSKRTRTQHLPLGKALEEYAEKSKNSLLLSLLLPVQRAAEKSAFLNTLLETGKIFKPLAWGAQEAYQFLQDIPHFESAGVMVRVPNWWNAHKPPRPTINVKVGDQNSHHLGLNTLLDFRVSFALPSGETLTQKEFTTLLRSTKKLVQIKGQWVQVDNEKLAHVLSHWKTIERQVKTEGLSFAAGLRLLSGIEQQQSEAGLSEELTTWSKVIEGNWIQSTLSRLRNPQETDEANIHVTLEKALQAKLRPYQARGVQWLWWLYNIRLGGCLADDMGLGKTIQVISLVLLVKQQKILSSTQSQKSQGNQSTHLLVLPTSLLGNWQAEIKQFAPSLSFRIVHRSMHRDAEKPDLSTLDLVITTYGLFDRLPWISETAWDMVILDEAQAIKNPATKQTRAIKGLKSQVRFILTGTPIENRLLDIWSLFDFIAPGLLGTSRVFAEYGKKLKQANENNASGEFYAAVRSLIKPYILRRLKTDKSIISDLPDKTEIATYCTLTKQQVGLYQQAVNELATQLEKQTDGIQRRGLVMSYLLRFKQICNHPNQWLGHGDYAYEMSGKFLRLKELCEMIADKQEKVLVFTQFREIIPAISQFLSQIFKQEGLFLHGQTTVKKRTASVARFQQEQGPPFFVLSLKAGGTGLNLTAASHVIHFDRWWNPAVENQATDRAFRIGQKANVLVHKLICRGTIEEKIDSLLSAKKSLSQAIMGQDNEIVFTELSDAELMNMVTLDIHRALGKS